MQRPRTSKLLSWGLAIAALTFVVWVVPIRDRCWDPRAPKTTKVALTHEASGGCVLHLQTGEVRIPADQCARLQCEPGVTSALSHARPWPVLGLLVLYVLGSLVWAARWRALLDFADIELSVMQVWRLSVEAQAGGILLPGGLGGDALRITSVLSKPTRSGARAPAPLVVASVLLDRFVGLGTIAALAAGLGFAFGGVDAGPLAIMLAGIPVALLLGLSVLRWAPVHRIDWLVQGRLGQLVNPVLAYLRDPRALRSIAIAVALSILVAAVQLGVIRGLVYSLGETPTAEKWIFVGTAMAFIVAAVPALPGGWGTADAAYVFFFGLAGVSVATALAVCLMFRLFWYLLGIAGAVLHLARRKPPSS
jgi:glycosyltransferase 2 family protein